MGRWRLSLSFSALPLPRIRRSRLSHQPLHDLYQSLQQRHPLTHNGRRRDTPGSGLSGSGDGFGLSSFYYYAYAYYHCDDVYDN